MSVFLHDKAVVTAFFGEKGNKKLYIVSEIYQKKLHCSQTNFDDGEGW